LNGSKGFAVSSPTGELKLEIKVRGGKVIIQHESWDGNHGMDFTVQAVDEKEVFEPENGRLAEATTFLGTRLTNLSHVLRAGEGFKLVSQRAWWTSNVYAAIGLR